MMDRWVPPRVPSDPSSALGGSGEPSPGCNPLVASWGHNDRVHDDLGQQRGGVPTEPEAPEAPEAPVPPEAREGPEVRMLASSVVYADQWLTFRRDETERNDGARGTYAFVEKRNFALIIPAENGGFHLVEEYRYPLGRRGWSFPQGGFPH